MPTTSYCWIVGEKQGEIHGSCVQQGRENSLLIEAFNHEVRIPRDRHSGLPSGQRVHEALSITKLFDQSSPKLYQALTSGEHLSEVVFKFFRINKGGFEEHYFTIKLEDAIVVSMKAWVPNCLDPLKEQFQHMEDVAFTYRKITWTWEPDGIEAEDDWMNPGHNS